jgi:hypothetical protein
MPFGPMNGPSTYTTMMFELKGELIALFLERHPEHNDLIDNSHTIIDDILTWCTDPDTLPNIFKCVCIIFQKYCISFRLDKFSFFIDRFEYVGHDTTSAGNIPAPSKYIPSRTGICPKL